MYQPCIDKPIRIRLLGELEISVANTPGHAGIRYLKPKLLLAMLALARGKACTRAELAETLWPGESSDARANLRHALFVLRQLLATVPDAWNATGKTLALRPEAVHVDVLALMSAPGYDTLSLAQRLAYDQGRFLEYADLPDNAPFTAWKTSWQSQIERDVVQCHNLRLAELMAIGDNRQALDHAKQWVQRYPDFEDAHRQLIQLLLDQHEADAAMHAYQHCVNMMRQHFDAAPSPAIRALIEREPSQDANETACNAMPRISRPLSALAIVLSIDDADECPDTVLAQRQIVRRRVQDYARGEGGYVRVGADDSLVVLYGYPECSERPAHSAARLALGLQTLNPPGVIQVSMGLHTGLASATPGRGADPGLLIGQQATRLAYLAEPGDILVTSAAHDRLDDQYELCRNAHHGTPLWRLIATREHTTIGRMFGRVREFDRLVRRWTRLPGAQPPTAVIVRGEAGVGKSLLARVMSDYVRHTGGIVRTLRSNEDHRGTPFYPVLECLTQQYVAGQNGNRQRCGLPIDRAQFVDAIQQHLGWNATARSRLRRMLFPDDERIHDQRVPQGIPSRDLPSGLADLVVQRAEPQCPVLVVWEDIHWSDPSSIQVLTEIMRHTYAAPTMVLLTTRNAFVCEGKVRELMLFPLARSAVVELIAHRTRERCLSAVRQSHIAQQSGGIPLYIEAMLRQPTTGATTGVPPLTMDLIVARLSRLSPEARHALQFAAATGAFDATAMSQASAETGGSPQPFASVLTELREQGWINDGTPAQFRCPLVRDAIYQTLAPAQQARYRDMLTPGKPAERARLASPATLDAG